MRKSSISMGHLYHGYVSHNQRVYTVDVHISPWPRQMDRAPYPSCTSNWCQEKSSGADDTGGLKNRWLMVVNGG